MVVTENQPTGSADLARAFADPAAPVTVAETTSQHGRRIEQRRLRASTERAGSPPGLGSSRRAASTGPSSPSAPGRCGGRSAPMRSPPCRRTVPAQPRSCRCGASTGTSRIRCTGCAMSPSVRRVPAFALVTFHRAWLPYVTPLLAWRDWPVQRTSPPLAAASRSSPPRLSPCLASPDDFE